ncbi:MAG: SPOR domain-containing protein [Zymomonas mobilis]|uniref:SPOR domain-containing protein n=1 Tax=Zymomonas mobilis TaxID=542 RepID=UPI0039EC9082
MASYGINLASFLTAKIYLIRSSAFFVVLCLRSQRQLAFYVTMAIEIKDSKNGGFGKQPVPSEFIGTRISAKAQKTSYGKIRYIVKSTWVSFLVLTGIPCYSVPLQAQIAENETGSDKADLTVYLRRLAAQPHDTNALIGAGLASYRAGDLHAAYGFLSRAETLAPHDGKVKAALGSIFIQQEKPQQALKYFHEAVSNGIPAAIVASDSGLAYDLLGNKAKAEAAYTMALSSHPDDETERRFALSQAIAGHASNALALIDRQLRQQNRAAWRTRALILALTGDVAGANAIIKSTMPAGSAEAMASFLSRLPHLSAQEKAAAVHFGDMKVKGSSSQSLWAENDKSGPADTKEPVSDFNIDSIPATPEDYVTSEKPMPLAPQAPRPEVGEDPIRPLTVKDDDREPPTPKVLLKSRRGNVGEKANPVAVTVSPPVVPAPAVSPVLPKPKSKIASAPIVQEKTSEKTLPTAKKTPVRSEAELKAYCKINIENSLKLPAKKAVKGKIIAKPAHASKTPSKVELLKINQCIAEQKALDQKAEKSSAKKAGNLPIEASEKNPKTLNGKKDLSANSPATTIEKKNSHAAVDTKTAAETKAVTKSAHEATSERYWVQVASGENKANLLAVWQKLLTKYPLLKTTQPWTSPWHKSHRLLAGPFSSDEQAQDFVNKLKKHGFSTIQFTSRKTVPVERLTAK